MSDTAFSQNPLVTRLVSDICRSLHCTNVQCIDSDEGADINLVLCREMAPCHSDAFHLSHLLTENGYIFCDQNYLKTGFIHAKFDNAFDIWADSRSPVEPGQSLVVDFSGEFFVGKESSFLTNQDQCVSMLFERMQQAIFSFDSAVRESREDIVRIFGNAHPWDWTHRQRLHTEASRWL